jgi:hypothetical protein
MKVETEAVEYTITQDTLIRNFYVETVMGRDLFDLIITKYGKGAWNVYMERLLKQRIFASGGVPYPTSGNYDDYCMPARIKIDMSNEDFRNADLSGLDLSVPVMNGCDFSGANLAGAKMGYACGSLFRGADLRGVRIENPPAENHVSIPNLDHADFCGANLSGANINKPRGALFQGANLENATLCHDVSDADFTGANLSGIILEEGITCGKFKMPRGFPEQYLAQCRLLSSEWYCEDYIIRKRMTAKPMLKGKSKFRSFWEEWDYNKILIEKENGR